MGFIYTSFKVLLERTTSSRILWRLIPIIALATVYIAQANTEEALGHSAAFTFLWIAVILIAAKISSLVERWGQPSVLGELVIGVIIGNLTLLGLNWFEPIKLDPIIAFLSELGVVILLFQIGLESNISKMKKVGIRAFLVALIGVIVPFILGTYIVGPWLMPGLAANAYLFIGATLTATSVGITARVFKDLKKLQIPEAQIVLGAAVIDDVMGLIILAVVSAIVTVGTVGIGMITWITANAILFLVLSIVIGQLIAPKLGKWFAQIHTGSGMKITLAISFGLIMAFLAQEIGLAPIVGAFAAGLILDPIHFKNFKDPQVIEDIKSSLERSSDQTLKIEFNKILSHHSERHIEDLIEPIGFFLVPLFFVYTGINVKLETMFDLPVLLIALGITATAFIGKIVSGLAAGKVNKLIVGFGMIPRGEVGLIFAVIGKSLGVVNDEVFSIVVIMVILTTLATPPILSYLLKKQDKKEN
ncbi:MAG: Sodium/hydrogen exchanger [Candidatus Nomurabacteria bacterium GW2011_GWE1_32_28]|uniref:Sodium/hydrogen exchanger n=1 Tax=Candidatus Nomurabacteria bacterium GW2011_GWF1_31_48 TaxID=1618767 RepID=A0A0F9YF70_9BACT|nr:MAG: Sodium/hydrogen exchanger [Candidatus Nomurabacteria bacterium GW2011_GWF2_30_133]KKP28747.1 MAG: Sodium/hydrogen exchanger [Candidatus Nomurabacteria bacterium GW2011_GWE2_31_40]KKP30324.1 MAG: Sodium/hydrogen exchanger [Candidatus Nomurabacteria bacterium GW2011_GWF1_31_48]KKP34851.1 MAG: Sodium/hydrogen exchanger [Candidatus Nomurabacteria bacterium GW2011_GWE1_32_28]HAS80691.1 cation:proton antiporter [Candidatus Nomurabacteria bacterium]